MSWGKHNQDKILVRLAKDIRWAYRPVNQLGIIIDECVEDLSDPCIYELLTQYGLDESYSEAYDTYPRPTIRHVMYVLYEKAWALYKDRPIVIAHG